MAKPERRRKYWGKLILRMRFFTATVFAVIILSIANLYLLKAVVVTGDNCSVLKLNLVMIIINFIILGIFMLAVLVIVLQRTLEPLPRIEKELEKFIQGDRNIRINLRQKDMLRPMIEKINIILERFCQAQENKE